MMMRHAANYGYLKKDDDYSVPLSGARTYLALVYNGTTGRPTRLGWIILVVMFIIIWSAVKEASSSEDSPDTDRFDDRDINPRFKMMDPAIPNAQLGEFIAIHEKNMAKGVQKVEVPVFDPNKHPVPQRVRDEQRRERHDRPKPKEYPVPLVKRPDVGTLCPDGELDFLFVVDSVAKDVKMRDAIRNTWASRQLPTIRNNKSNKNVRWAVVFVTGVVYDNSHLAGMVKKVEMNATDVLSGDLPDTPHEGTRKFQLAIDWIVDQLAPACRLSYVMHTKQRIFHNVLLLIKMILKTYPDPDEPIYAGRLLRKDVPVRDVNDLNYVPPADYDKDFFPDLIRRPVYLFTMAAYQKLYDVKGHVTPIAMEDAYVGLLAERAGVKPTNNDNFEMMKMSVNNEQCNFIHRYFVYDTSSKDMRQIFAKFVQELKVCPI